MTKKIVIPCVIGGASSPTEFFIGSPAEGSNPIAFQAKWLSSAKNGSVSPQVLKALQDLYELSQTSKISFEDLCIQAFSNNK
jgi:hypothetical protein